LAAPEESPATSVSGQPPSPQPSAIDLALGGAIARADIPALCERARAVLEGSDDARFVCDVGALVEPDAVTVDALARLQLTARRLGRRIQLHHACGELQELLAFVGLTDVVPCAESGVKARGKAEDWEQAGGVQEEADSGDETA
jgi:ABC-type transporter Mla MlaB component